MKRKRSFLLREMSALHRSVAAAAIGCAIASSAVALPAVQTFEATSGSMVQEFPNDSLPYTAASSAFSFSGVITPFGTNPFLLPFSVGNQPGFTLIGDTTTPTLAGVTLSVGGAPWALPSDVNMDGGTASAEFNLKSFVLKGPGTDFGTFDFRGQFIGVPLSELSAHPGADCGPSSPITCKTVRFTGSGTVEFDVVPWPNIPGELEISKATFTFKAPEPPTSALLLLGFAGLVVMGRRRKSHTTMIQAG